MMQTSGLRFSSLLSTPSHGMRPRWNVFVAAKPLCYISRPLTSIPHTRSAVFQRVLHVQPSHSLCLRFQVPARHSAVRENARFLCGGTIKLGCTSSLRSVYHSKDASMFNGSGALKTKQCTRGYSSNSQANPYEVLGLPKNATLTDIKKQYRELAKQYHPDLNPGPESAGKMAEISAAYQLLSDPKRREFYDRSGIYPDDSGFPQSTDFPGGGATGFGHGSTDSSFVFTDFTSFFTDAFGSNFARPGGHVHRGEDIATEVTLEFLEAAMGCRKVVHLHTNAACDDCNGSGCSAGTSLSTCRTCNGTGTQKIERGPIIFGTVCSRCNGSGQVVAHPCKGCRGSGVKPQPRAVDLDFPAGVRHGMELRVSHQGHAGVRGGKAGDLFVKVIVKPHPQFKLIHDDFHITVPLTLKQCLTGGEVCFPTLEGKLNLIVPPGTVPGDVKTLRGKGIKKIQERGYGDLVVRWGLQVPRQLTDRQKQLILEFDEIEHNKTTSAGSSSQASRGSTATTKGSPPPPPKPSHCVPDSDDGKARKTTSYYEKKTKYSTAGDAPQSAADPDARAKPSTAGRSNPDEQQGGARAKQRCTSGHNSSTSVEM